MTSSLTSIGLLALVTSIATATPQLRVTEVDAPPTGSAVRIQQLQRDETGPTSFRYYAPRTGEPTKEDTLVYAEDGIVARYYYRDRDLGQTFKTGDVGFKLTAITVRLQPVDVAKADPTGAKVSLQIMKVTGSPKINDNGTTEGANPPFMQPAWSTYAHKWPRDHRDKNGADRRPIAHYTDDFIEGEHYESIAVISGGVIPEGLEKNDYLRWDLGAAAVPLEANSRYAFLFLFDEPAPPGVKRNIPLSNKNVVPGPHEDDVYPDGHAIRREGSSTHRDDVFIRDQDDPEDVVRARRSATFPADRKARLALQPGTLGYPDVDTYRDLYFVIEGEPIDLPKRPVGDRRPAIHCVYPRDLMAHENANGNIIDVTAAPYSLKGDGRSDCTAGLIQLYDDILDRLEASGWQGGGPNRQVSPIIYFPKGTYLISDTIIYSGKERAAWNLVPEAVQRSLKREGAYGDAWDGVRNGKPSLDFQKIRQTDLNNFWEHVARIRFVGEERDSTIIQLKDHSDGFGIGANKPLLSFGKSHFNNHVAMHAVRNLTLSTGKGNPGASGIRFNGANTCDITNTTIRSEDGTASIGIDIPIPPTQGYHSNLTIDGFDYGIHLSAFHVTHPVFEYLTLSNIGKAGIYVGNSSVSARALHYTGQAPALEIDSAAGMATLIDSKLDGRGSKGPAIRISKGAAVLRDIETRGFGKTLESYGRRTSGGSTIGEAIVGQTILGEGAKKRETLRLPVREVPPIHWETDLAQWANAQNYGATGDGETDDTAAIQRAMNSGKSVVYFPAKEYRTKGKIAVPASVKRINGLFHPVHMKLDVNEASTHSLVVEDAVHIHIEQSADRPVIMSHLIFTSAASTANGFRPQFFINGCSACGIKDIRNADIWCRFINPEGNFLPLTARAGTNLWVFGFKTERGGNKGNHDLRVTRGGNLEVLGGVSGVEPQGLLIHEGGRVSLSCVMSTHGFMAKNDPELIVESATGEDKVLRKDAFPQRSSERGAPGVHPHEIMVPLYTAGSE